MFAFKHVVTVDDRAAGAITTLGQLLTAYVTEAHSIAESAAALHDQIQGIRMLLGDLVEQQKINIHRKE